jgi:hypothetical protein
MPLTADCGRLKADSSSWRIVSTRMEWMAAADAGDAFAGAAAGAVLLYRFDKVPTARRLEPALATQERAQRPLV